ncbi:MAG: type IV pilus biogenesis/stability protein PilW [Gammaproteobacteria bacterium]|nr:type IV pilus biogenesis/stability protein PilW [Gammaproteobacteria bacterium]NNC96869.1 type IV pilus biogenesis/stability protein PilW [Gammaproteobacteria bacterium]NNM13014.1 type IV pilus biogenesis/stability protein PilW [Gammaproteobacteria bacterium]
MRNSVMFNRSTRKCSIRLMLVLGLFPLIFTSACVSINTGQPATTANTNKLPQQSKRNTESKVSLEEAARFNMTLGAQYLKQNDLEQAINKLNKAVTQQPNLALAHAYLGFAHEQIGDLPKAKIHYARAIKLDPSDPVALNNYGTFLCRQNDVRESLVYFEKAAENRLYQTPDAAYANAGVCARKIPDLVAANKYFRKAIGVNPKYTPAYYHLADLSLEQGKPDAAREFLKSLTKYTPESSQSADYLWLGFRIERAARNYDKAGYYSVQLQQKYPSSKQAKQLLDR